MCPVTSKDSLALLRWLIHNWMPYCHQNNLVTQWGWVTSNISVSWLGKLRPSHFLLGKITLSVKWITLCKCRPLVLYSTFMVPAPTGHLRIIYQAHHIVYTYCMHVTSASVRTYFLRTSACVHFGLSKSIVVLIHVSFVFEVLVHIDAENKLIMDLCFATCA